MAVSRSCELASVAGNAEGGLLLEAHGKDGQVEDTVLPEC